MTSDLRHWLASPAGLSALRECAMSIERHARIASLDLCQVFRGEQVADDGDLRQIIAAELAIFLLEYQDSVSRDIADDIQRGDISAVIAKISTKFTQHLIDKRRTYEISPFHAYLRHLRKVISQSPEVRYGTDDSGSWYAYSEDMALIVLPYAWQKQPFDGWPAPPVPFADIDRQLGILCLSRFYWDEAVASYAAEYLLPLLELTRFVFAKYPVAVRRKDPAPIGKNDRDERDLLDIPPGANVSFGSHRQQSERLDYDLIEHDLARLAEQCLSGMDDRQADILWRAAEGQTLDAIARQLGESGPSGVHYHLKKAHNNIRKFWSLWGNAQLPGFAEEDEEEQFIFIEKIVELCKNRCEGRTS